MLDFLNDANISQGTINEMYQMNKNMIYNLHENAENCLGIIMLFQKLKIVVIEDLLLYKPEWFLNTFEYVSSCFKKDNDLAKKINENYNNVVI